MTGIASRKRSHRVAAASAVTALLASAAALCAASPAAAAAGYGTGNSGWVNYYTNPTDTATWSAFCAGGGGSKTLTVPGIPVPACGPTGGMDIDIPLAYPYTAGGETYTPGFQCVELTDRYMYVTRHWGAIDGDGADVARIYGAAHGMSPVHNGTAGQAPQVGDVISFSVESNFTDDGGNYPGHTAIVAGTNVNSSGNGSITIMSENYGDPETATTTALSVSDWSVQAIPTFGSSGLVTTRYIEWLPLGGSTPPAGGVDTEIAFQANTTSLWTVGTDNHGAWNLGMMKGTSPSVSDLTAGGYEVAFQANTGDLWTVGASTHGSWGLAMMAGTSPSVAGLSTGGYEVAFQASTGSLSAVGADDAGSLGLGMMKGTSPAIAAQPGGGYVIAFQANTGDLYVDSSASGAKNLQLGMMAGTSPAIAELPGGGYVIAFQANTGDLWVYSSVTGAQAYGLGMMAGTSPSIAALPGGGYVVAFQANTGNLYLHSTVTGNSVLGLGMYKGTSPAIATLPGGGVEVAFEANTTDLYTYVPGSGARNLELGMLAGTSPAIS